jgi:thioredoxin 1
MNLRWIGKVAIIVLVAAAVVVVLRLKRPESGMARDEGVEFVGSAISVEPPGDAARDTASAGARPADAQALPSASDALAGDTPLPMLMDLGADKCIPCKKMAPILEALRAEFAGRFDVVFIDVWKNREAAVPYQIRLIPTQIFFDEAGNELFRHEGFLSREDILAKWAELSYAFLPPPEDDAG